MKTNINLFFISYILFFYRFFFLYIYVLFYFLLFYFLIIVLLVMIYFLSIYSFIYFYFIFWGWGVCVCGGGTTLLSLLAFSQWKRPNIGHRFRMFYLSRLVGKPAMWFPNRSDTNRTVQAQKRAIRLKVEEELYYPSSENKGADQLRSYCEADLRLCCRLCRLLVFPWGGLFEYERLTSSNFS